MGIFYTAAALFLFFIFQTERWYAAVEILKLTMCVCVQRMYNNIESRETDFERVSGLWSDFLIYTESFRCWVTYTIYARKSYTYVYASVTLD